MGADLLLCGLQALCNLDSIQTRQTGARNDKPYGPLSLCFEMGTPHYTVAEFIRRWQIKINLTKIMETLGFEPRALHKIIFLCSNIFIMSLH